MKKESRKNRSVHFIGIGGIGISSLARWFLSDRWIVSGSDLAANKITKELAREGVRICGGHKKTNVPRNAELVVYSQAVPAKNPELIEARRLKIPTLSYPQTLGKLTKTHTTIAIAGAHGKSTTTALTGLILKNAGLNPTIVVGTELKELGGKNFRKGGGNYLVIEADEWKASFLNYSPTLLIITNIDREHLDFYKNLGNVKNTFLKFIARTKSGGTLVLNKDNAVLAALAKRIAKISREKNIRVVWYSTKDPVAQAIRKIIKIPGEHNISNAVAAYAAARVLNVPQKKILSVIGVYHGSWRRFEYRGDFRVKSQESRVKQSVPIYDGYAHHPTEIAATLKGFREKFTTKNIICVFQPHQAKRLHSLFKEFICAFEAADTIVITPIYKVAGRDERISLRFSPEALARVMQKKYPRKPIFYLSDFKNLKNALTTLVTVPPTCAIGVSPKPKSHSNSRSEFGTGIKPAVVVMMGAGDIVQYTDALLTTNH